MDERLQFVGRRLAGEPMAELCREFGISRKTGYKIFDRYQECGVHGLTDRSRRPFRYANQLPFQVENYILNVKREHLSWGARKIRERLTRRFSGIPIPAKSTIHAVLDRHGLVERRGRLRRRAQGTPLSLGQRPNELWCTDYKGEFLLGNRQYCYPLTITDHASRFLLTCEALSSTREDYAFTVFERLSHCESKSIATRCFEDIVGSSEALRKVLRQVARVAPSVASVLLCSNLSQQRFSTRQENVLRVLISQIQPYPDDR
jgi:transposase